MVQPGVANGSEMLPTCGELVVVKLNENTIVSGSDDKTLRVWDLTNDTSRVLRGHTNSVFSVMKLNETTIVSGSWDNSLRMWDLAKTFNPVVVVKKRKRRLTENHLTCTLIPVWYNDCILYTRKYY